MQLLLSIRGSLPTITDGCVEIKKTLCLTTLFLLQVEKDHQGALVLQTLQALQVLLIKFLQVLSAEMDFISLCEKRCVSKTWKQIEIDCMGQSW